MGERINAGDSDEVLEALELLKEALRASAEVDARIVERIEHIQKQRGKGLLYAEIVPAEPRPLIVEMLTANLDRLATAGNRLRRVEAQALYDNGLTMDEIAVLFGVTRQRIGTLLRPRQD
jgi:hypothetical protein